MNTQLQDVIASAVDVLDLELVGCELIRRPHRSLLRVYVDKPGGVTVDDCAETSRQIGGVLDVEELMSGRYDLEVSSPGIERPLFTIDHYRRFIGSNIYIKCRELLSGRRQLQGLLEAVTDEEVVMIVDGQRFDVPFENIQKGHIIIL
jgi:ribosome maturation factor RimP